MTRCAHRSWLLFIVVLGWTETTLAQGCPPGQVMHPEGCCWLGQVRRDGACTGRPMCPAGMTTEGDDCVGEADSSAAPAASEAPTPTPSSSSTESCTEGRVAVEDGYCCWPDQRWSFTQGRCAGLPRCPADRIESRGECVLRSRSRGERHVDVTLTVVGFSAFLLGWAAPAIAGAVLAASGDGLCEQPSAGYFFGPLVGPPLGVVALDACRAFAPNDGPFDELAYTTSVIAILVQHLGVALAIVGLVGHIDADQARVRFSPLSIDGRF
jgi:hypothetical protein